MVALSRSLPILPEAVAVTAGLVRMPFGRFCVSLVCGCVPLGFTFAWIGAAGHDAPGWAISLSVIVPALLWFAAKRLMK
jgi:membrane protein DedA with SNARE-associated domain